MNEFVLDYLLSLLPQHFRPAVRNYLTIYPETAEIRLRLNSPLSFTARGGNVITALTVTRPDIDYITSKLTDNNLLLYEPLIKLGYIPLKYNMRAGVCGDAFLVDGIIRSIRRISYINIRIPLTNSIDCTEILDYIALRNYSCGLLVISAPGAGKTTLLRSLADGLSSPPHSRRVSVIDTNRELMIAEYKNSLIDLFSGYPKADGISIATRYFNPQYIICDELGTSLETKAICETLNTGVPIIASAHAFDLSDVQKRQNLAILLEKQVFDAVIQIIPSENEHVYKIIEL